MINVTPYLAAAAEAKLEDWGPLDEATGGPMHTSGIAIWTGTWQIHDTIRKLYVLF